MAIPQSAALDRFLGRLNGARRERKDFKAPCPAHHDQNPSLFVREANGRILVKCFAGCSTKDVCKAIGIEMADLFSDNRSAKHIVTEYPYTDEQGKLLYQKVRYDPKNFRLRKPNGRGRWSWGLGDVHRVLYRLPKVLAAKEILIVECEKDADK
jgi:putative DNA primase/helicase